MVGDCGGVKKTHVSVAEAAEMMGVHAETIRRMLAAGRLAGERVSDSPRSPWLVLVSSIESFGVQGVPTDEPDGTTMGAEGE